MPSPRDKPIEISDKSASADRKGGALPTLRRHSVRDLLGGEREAILEHDGQNYRLRITSNGKLILTK